MNTQGSGGARVRDVVAAVALWVPLAVMVMTWLVGREALPAELPRQWGSTVVSSTWLTSLAMALLVLAVPMLAFARLQISVDWRGVKVVTWILGISLKTIPLASIESVHTEALKPMHWGGWGTGACLADRP